MSQRGRRCARPARRDERKHREYFRREGPEARRARFRSRRGRPAAWALGWLTVLTCLWSPHAGATPGAAPIERSLRVHAFYEGEPNREAWRAELQAAVATDLLARQCFRRIVEEGEADVVLHIAVESLAVEEARRQIVPDSGPPDEEGGLRGVRAEIEGAVRLASPSGATLVGPERFVRVAEVPASGPAGDPLARAVALVLEEPVRVVRRLLCRKPEDLERRIDAALAAEAPSAPSSR